jgi:hypothetical protein
VVVEAATHSIASLLTVSGSGVSRDAAAEALRWMVPAGVAHIFAAVAASGLAALDDYATPALGYAIGSVAGLALILARVDGSGLAAVAWGVALNASIALLVPLVVLLARAVKAQAPRGAFRPSGPPMRSRLTSFGVAVSVPLVLQLLYVVCVPFAGRDGVGAQTSLAYAYLAASALVAVTASSLGLVTSVPLTRAGLGSEDAGRHVVYASWVAYSLIGAAAGVVALAGEYGGEVGQEIGRLIAAFSPWMAVSVAVSVAFPLAFVVGRTRRLPWIGAAALAAQIPLAWVGEAGFGLDGLAFSLALSTSVVLGALLYELGTLGSAARGLAAAALVTAGIGIVAFVPFSLIGPVPGALLGLAAYVGAFALTRPRKFVLGWRYFRTLA